MTQLDQTASGIRWALRCAIAVGGPCEGAVDTQCHVRLCIGDWAAEHA